MIITYSNLKGTVTMNGNGKGIWNIKSIDGLGFVPSDYQVATFPHTIGQKTISEHKQPRTITIALDLTRECDKQNERRKVLQILNEKGVMIIKNTPYGKEIVRRIECRCTAFEEEPSRKGEFSQIAAQFICDNPYFTDEDQTVVSAVNVQNKITDEFSLPMAFTEFTNRGDIHNYGDVNSEPIITMTGSGQTETASIIIANKTTKQQIKLNTNISDGEIITVDIPNREITSNMRSDTEMLESLDYSTYLSDFWLESGTNDIEITCDDYEHMGVTFTFYNQYLEGGGY